MKLKILSLVFVTITTIKGFTQDNKEVLFKVDNEPVYVTEFLRVYNKNLDLVQDESQKDVDEYLNLFTNYKLKLRQAREEKLHEKESYKKELSSYKKQLAKSYMSDSEITDALVKEGYNSISHDVNANHILVKVDENATPQDSLLAYNKIKALRERTLKEGFETVRKEVHDGKTIHGEELGYFTGFKMVYKFEKVAFNTPVGEISEPFRTRFGYHIVKVLDKRKSQGERTVKHIMIFLKKGDSLTNSKAEGRIKEIYKKIEQGEPFEALAKQFSEDKNTAPKGGLLAPFSSGVLRAPKFEEAAFALQNVDDISKPVKSQYGWHIIKLVKAKPIPSFEELKPELEAKIKKDSRSKLIEEALIGKLKTKYGVGNEVPHLDYFKSILNDDFYKNTWELPSDFRVYDVLVKIGDKELLFSDFGDVLLQQQNRRYRNKLSFDAIVKNAYNVFIGNSLKQYQEDHLEDENEDYAYILGEYRDGLLLFDLMESNIWQSAKTDSLEIKNYYDKHKASYFWPVRANGVVASSSNKKTINKVAKLLKSGKSIDAIKKQINVNDKVNVIFTKDTMGIEHQALPKTFKINKGISKVYKHNNGFIVADVKEVLPKKQKAFEEVKGLVMSDYQTYKENLWLEELRKKYPIELNTDVLKKVKTKIKNNK